MTHSACLQLCPAKAISFFSFFQCLFGLAHTGKRDLSPPLTGPIIQASPVCLVQRLKFTLTEGF